MRTRLDPHLWLECATQLNRNGIPLRYQQYFIQIKIVLCVSHLAHMFISPLDHALGFVIIPILQVKH